MPRNKAESRSDLYGMWVTSLISTLDKLVDDFVISVSDDTKIDIKIRNFSSLVRSVEKVQMMVESAYEKPAPEGDKGIENSAESVQDADKLRREIARRLTRLADAGGKAKIPRKPKSE